MELDSLYYEVHILAYYYNWSEEKILRLSSRKRAKYLELIKEQIKLENEANSAE